MNPIQKSVMATGNRVASWLYSRTEGRIGGSARGIPVLVLTVAGRRTGKPRSVPVAYFDHDGGYLVAATAGGATSDPQWIRNLASAGTAHIQVGDQEHEVDVRIAEGAERDRLWSDVVVARAPAFGKYDKKSGQRAIPIALLTPRS